MNKLQKKILIKRLLYMFYNSQCLIVAIIFDRFLQMLLFILFFESIQNCFKYRFHADYICEEPIKASKLCKIITIIVELLFLCFCKKLDVSLYSNIFVILIIAILNALLGFFIEQIISKKAKLKDKDFIFAECEKVGLTKLAVDRLIKHYIDGLTINEIAIQECVEAETIKQSIRRSKRKLKI